MTDRTLVALMAAIIYNRDARAGDAIQAAKDILCEIETAERQKQKAERLSFDCARQWWDYVEGKEK